MGFREYNPGLNRYLSRDYYNGALNDLALGADPWNTNRYAFVGGNPITRVEIDGHYGIDENGDRLNTVDTHDAALVASYNKLLEWQEKTGFEGTISMDTGEGGRNANLVVNGHKNRLGTQPGYTDLRLTGSGNNAGQIYVWEVKPGNEDGRTEGPKQLQNYIDKLRIMHPDAVVERGFTLDPAKFYARDGRPGRVWSEAAPNDIGMRYYGMEPRPSPPSVRVPTQTSEEDRDRRIELDGESVRKGILWGVGAVVGVIIGGVAVQATS